jgi:hypothetical protein
MESMVSMWHSRLIIKQTEPSFLSRKERWHFQEIWLSAFKPKNFMASASGRNWPAYVRFKTSGNLVTVNLRTLLIVEFKTSWLAWN